MAEEAAKTKIKIFKPSDEKAKSISTQVNEAKDKNKE